MCHLLLHTSCLSPLPELCLIVFTWSWGAARQSCVTWFYLGKWPSETPHVSLRSFEPTHKSGCKLCTSAFHWIHWSVQWRCMTSHMHVFSLIQLQVYFFFNEVLHTITCCFLNKTCFKTIHKQKDFNCHLDMKNIYWLHGFFQTNTSTRHNCRSN